MRTLIFGVLLVSFVGCDASEKILKLNEQLQAEIQRKDVDHRRAISELTDRYDRAVAEHTNYRDEIEGLRKAEKLARGESESLRIKVEDLESDVAVLKGKLKNLGFPEP